MQTLANISQFEALQANANVAMGIQSEMSVFNESPTATDILTRMAKALESAADNAADPPQEFWSLRSEVMSNPKTTPMNHHEYGVISDLQRDAADEMLYKIEDLLRKRKRLGAKWA